MKENRVKENQDKALREHLLELVKGGGAHAKFDDAVADLPDDLRGNKVEALPYTFWMVLEHMRIARLQCESEIQSDEMARWLLAEDQSAAQCRGLEQQHQGV